MLDRTCRKACLSCTSNQRQRGVAFLGAAYGGQCIFSRYSGGLTFVSYRDPNLIAALDTYDRTADLLRNAELNEEELTLNITRTIGEVDSLSARRCQLD